MLTYGESPPLYFASFSMIIISIYFLCRYSVPGQEKFANSYKISVSAILKKRVLSKETLFFNMA